MLNPIWLLSIAILWYKKKQPLFQNYIFFLRKCLGLLKFDCTCHVSIVILERSVGRILSFIPSPMSVIASKFIFSYYFFIYFYLWLARQRRRRYIILRASDYLDQLSEMPRIAKSTTIYKLLIIKHCFYKIV